MGGTTFETYGEGKSAKEAFNAAREQAQWDHGHAGYTGTLAEKPGFIEFTLPEGVTEDEFLDAVYKYQPLWDRATNRHLPGPKTEWAAAWPDWDRMYEVYDKKWDEAVAIKVAEGKWLFCGWASC